MFKCAGKVAYDFLVDGISELKFVYNFEPDKEQLGRIQISPSSRNPCGPCDSDAVIPQVLGYIVR